MADLYTVLGVSRNASDEEIKRAYRRESLRWHPDRNPSPNAKQMFQIINDANTVLSNSRLRRIYDRQGNAGLTAERERSAKPSFSTMFNAFWNMGSEPQKEFVQPNVDINVYYGADDQKYNVSLSLSIDDFKEVLFKRFRVPIGRQILKFGDKELTSGKLFKYQIRNGSFMFLESR